MPLLSLEGYQTDTDERRGKGVYEILQNSIAKLRENGSFWGTSLMITRSNFDEVTDDDFVKKLVNAGCRLFMLVEYTPVKEGTEDWTLTEAQRLELVKRRDSFRKKYQAVFIALPWNEEEIGKTHEFYFATKEGKADSLSFGHSRREPSEAWWSTTMYAADLEGLTSQLAHNQAIASKQGIKSIACTFETRFEKALRVRVCWETGEHWGMRLVLFEKSMRP